MQGTLTKWGNSLGLRIPKALVQRFRLTEGVRVEVEAREDYIVISMPHGFRLQDLVAGMTPDDMRGAFNWGEERGREIID